MADRKDAPVTRAEVQRMLDAFEERFTEKMTRQVTSLEERLTEKMRDMQMEVPRVFHNWGAPRTLECAVTRSAS